MQALPCNFNRKFKIQLYFILKTLRYCMMMNTTHDTIKMISNIYLCLKLVQRILVVTKSDTT